MSRDYITERRAALLDMIRTAEAELVELEHAEWLLDAHDAEFPTEAEWRAYCEAAEAGAFDTRSDEWTAADEADWRETMGVRS